MAIGRIGAAMMGSNLIVRYLLDLGADINARKHARLDAVDGRRRHARGQHGEGLARHRGAAARTPTSLDSVGHSILIYRKFKISFQPVEPKPPVPRVVSVNPSTSTTSTVQRFWTTSWAIRIPRVTWKVVDPWLISTTPTSPRYPSSIVPGVLSTVTECFRARPLLGRTCASVASGSSIATPVDTRQVTPGSRATSSQA